MNRLTEIQRRTSSYQVGNNPSNILTHKQGGGGGDTIMDIHSESNVVAGVSRQSNVPLPTPPPPPPPPSLPHCTILNDFTTVYQKNDLVHHFWRTIPPPTPPPLPPSPNNQNITDLQRNQYTVAATLPQFGFINHCENHQRTLKSQPIHHQPAFMHPNYHNIEMQTAVNCLQNVYNPNWTTTVYKSNQLIDTPNNIPLIFGPPPRDKRSYMNPLDEQQNNWFCNKSNKRIINNEHPLTTTNNKMINCDQLPPPPSNSNRYNIKLQFSKNVVNIPKKMSVNNKSKSTKELIAKIDFSQQIDENIFLNSQSQAQHSLTLFDSDSQTPFILQEESAFIDMIVEGCLRGEEIATKYQNVPCFKNIKKLCEKTKSDLMTPHCTARNIHSQGIPWATKDYIFVFTRLTSCWYLLKGYLGERSDMFEKIEQLYSTDLRRSFEIWEQTTANLVYHIMKSFIALGNNGSVKYKQVNETTKHKDIQILTRNHALSEMMCSLINYKAANDDNGEEQLNKIDENCVENDEEARTASSKYIKPGCYPIPKVDKNTNNKTSSPPPPPPPPIAIILSENNQKEYVPFKKTPQGILTSALMKKTRDNTELDDKNTNEISSTTKIKLKTIVPIKKQYKHSDTRISTMYRKSMIVSTKRRSEMTDYQCCQRKFVKKSHKSFYNSILLTTPKQLFADDSHTIRSCYKNRPKWSVWYSKKNDGLSRLANETFENILNELWNMPSSHYFVFEVDIRDVPDYYEIVKYPIFLANILQKLKQCKYKTLNQAVHDFRRLFRNAQLFVDAHPNKKLQNLIINFSNTFEQSLKCYFPRMDFSNITGEPNEILMDCCFHNNDNDDDSNLPFTTQTVSVDNNNNK